jgi:hypothetical protein
MKTQDDNKKFSIFFLFQKKNYKFSLQSMVDDIKNHIQEGDTGRPRRNLPGSQEGLN